jgi:hypothetical protein
MKFYPKTSIAAQAAEGGHCSLDKNWFSDNFQWLAAAVYR